MFYASLLRRENVLICRDDARSAMPYFTSSSCAPETVGAEVAFSPGPPAGATARKRP